MTRLGERFFIPRARHAAIVSRSCAGSSDLADEIDNLQIAATPDMRRLFPHLCHPERISENSLQDESCMSLKNYYKILGVPLSATSSEIRNAFRSLAKKYHPDKAPDNPFAGAHFSDIQEAYAVLSNPSRRVAYDEERWLRGLAKRSDATVRVTPEWVLQEASRLRRHMDTVDTYRMNHAALRDYIAALLSPEHLSILQEAPELHRAVLDEIFASIKELRYEYTDAVLRPLVLLAGNNEDHQQLIAEWQSARRREAKWNRYRPFIVLFFAVLICGIIWWLK